MKELFGDVDLSQILGTDLTVLLIAPEASQASVMPSLIFAAHAKAPDALKRCFGNREGRKDFCCR